LEYIDSSISGACSGRSGHAFWKL